MKIMQLEKDNQSLTHELELIKLKDTYESKKGVDAGPGLEKEMLIQQKEFHDRLAEKDKEIVAKDKELVEKEKQMEMS